MQILSSNFGLLLISEAGTATFIYPMLSGGGGGGAEGKTKQAISSIRVLQLKNMKVSTVSLKCSLFGLSQTAPSQNGHTPMCLSILRQRKRVQINHTIIYCNNSSFLLLKVSPTSTTIT